MFRKFESRGRVFDSQPEGLGVAFFATGPGLPVGLIMYILTTLEFPKHNLDFHLLTTSVINAKYYYVKIYIYTVAYLGGGACGHAPPPSESPKAFFDEIDC